MNPKERSVFYRGVLFFIITVFVLTQLSSVDQQQYPWVSVVNIFAEVCLFLAGVVFVLFVISRQFKQSTNAPASSQQTQPAPSQQTQPASSQRSRFDFSSDSWFNMARLAVLASVILAGSVSELAPPGPGFNAVMDDACLFDGASACFPGRHHHPLELGSTKND